MESKDIQQRIERLRAQINDLRYRYHVLNDPEITDQMYEGLMKELIELERRYPELISPDSPTQRVSGKPLDKFEKVKHQVPQWSFNDAFNEQEIREWYERVKRFLNKAGYKNLVDLNLVVELKIDGLHIVLTYEEGSLKLAATRGDGKVGEDVTQNIKTIQSVPLVLKEKINIIVEGEVWLGQEMFKKINKERAKNKQTLFANPRNAAAGTIRQLDPRKVAERRLNLTVYDISSDNAPPTQAEELQRLKHLGFLTDNHWRVCVKLEEVFNFYKEIQKHKQDLPFWIDGLVIKVNQRKYQQILGYTGKAPRWAIAFKFPAEQATTKILDVYVQVGRTGALTPVALMEPVKLAGTTVQHATLHNFAEIKRLDVRIGDTVVVEKSGDIIPKVVRVLEKMRTGQEKLIYEPKRCPICGGPVIHKKILDKKQGHSIALYCANPNCYAKELQKIIHFVSKKGFNIDGLGKKIVEQLVNEGLIKDVADLFSLKKTELELLEGFAEKSASNLVQAIEKSKKINFANFIYALGIDHVGWETAEILAENFNNWSDLMKAGQEELADLPDIGEKVALEIKKYFSDEKNQKLLAKLFKQGVEVIYKKQNKKNFLHGQVFVLTGVLKSLTREEAKKKLKFLGAKVSNSVSHKTDYVIVGEKPGSKYDKALKLGVKILTEKDFLDLINKYA